MRDELPAMAPGETPSDLAARRDLAVREAMREVGLDPAYARAVLDMVDDDEASWAGCCGSSCDPCNATLALAARLTRRRIEAG
jgi:hypothetical protein